MELNSDSGLEIFPLRDGSEKGDAQVDKFIEYAPIIIVIVVFLIKNRLFVTPEQMQKERKNLLEEVERRFLSLAAFREYEKRMDDNFQTINRRFLESNDRFDKVDKSLEHITDLLINRD